jgi:hypothetical protein
VSKDSSLRTKAFNSYSTQRIIGCGQDFLLDRTEGKIFNHEVFSSQCVEDDIFLDKDVQYVVSSRFLLATSSNCSRTTSRPRPICMTEERARSQSSQAYVFFGRSAPTRRATTACLASSVQSFVSSASPII